MLYKLYFKYTMIQFLKFEEYEKQILATSPEWSGLLWHPGDLDGFPSFV